MFKNTHTNRVPVLTEPAETRRLPAGTLLLLRVAAGCSESCEQMPNDITGWLAHQYICYTTSVLSQARRWRDSKSKSSIGQKKRWGRGASGGAGKAAEELFCFPSRCFQEMMSPATQHLPPLSVNLSLHRSGFLSQRSWYAVRWPEPSRWLPDGRMTCFLRWEESKAWLMGDVGTCLLWACHTLGTLGNSYKKVDSQSGELIRMHVIKATR